MNSACETLHENTTNMSSTGNSGKLENTLDMSGKADQLLFADSRMNPSFNVAGDQALLNQYPEYSMLKRLQALVTSYYCNKCLKTHTFEKFFDDDHDCQHEEELLLKGAPQDEMSLEVEEFKGPVSTLRLREANTNASSRQHSVFVQSANLYTFNMGGDKRQDNNAGGIPADLFKPTNSQKPNVTKQNTEQNLRTKAIPRHAVTIDKTTSLQNKPTGNLRASELEASFEAELNPDKAQASGSPGFLNNNSNRQNIYVRKIREYMDKIDKLQGELSKCKTENESLIFDLRECKTKMAFLEEKKAMLQIELAREKKKRVLNKNPAGSLVSDDLAEEDKNINVTVHG